MKSVAHSEDEGTEDYNTEMGMRKRARAIIDEMWPGYVAHGPLIEEVVAEIIHTDEDGFIEEAIDEEVEKLGEARKWAKDAYGDDSPEDALCAYRVLFSQTDEERWDEVHELLRKRK